MSSVGATRLLSGFLVFIALFGCLEPESSVFDPTTPDGQVLLGLVDSQVTPRLPVSGAGLWLRAQDARIQNSQTLWVDRSDHASMLSGPALSVEPGSANGRPAVYFPGTPYAVGTLVPPLISSTSSILVVFKNGTPSPTGVNQTLVGLGSASGGFQFGLDGATGRLLALKSDILLLFIGVTPITDTSTYYIASVTYDASGNGSIYLNGTSEVNATNLQTLVHQGQVAIGGRYNSTEFLKGHIAEVIVFTSVLSATDRQALECYLAKRYGIGLSFVCN